MLVPARDQVSRELPSSGSADDWKQHPATRLASPCEKFACENLPRCKAEQLACDSFAIYARAIWGQKLKPPSEPNRAIFEKIYSEQDE